MVLKIKRNLFENSAGLYVFSTGNKPSISTFKVGMSSNLFTRLRSYHTCYKDGYFIHNIAKLVDYKGKFSKLNPNKKKNITNFVKKVERRVHTILKGDNPKNKNYQVGQLSSRTSEWFKTGDIEIISQAIRRAYKEISGDTITSNKKNLSAPTLQTDLSNVIFDD